MSVGRADVAEQEERDEGQSGQGEEEGGEGAGPGVARPLGQSRQGPAQQVAQVEDEEAAHGNEILLPALAGERLGIDNIWSGLDEGSVKGGGFKSLLLKFKKRLKWIKS